MQCLDCIESIMQCLDGMEGIMQCLDGMESIMQCLDLGILYLKPGCTALIRAPSDALFRSGRCGIVLCSTVAE